MNIKLWLLTLLMCLPIYVGAKEKLMPVPSEKEQAETQSIIHPIIESDVASFNAKKMTGSALGEKILNLMVQEESPVAQYCLLKTAMEYFSLGGDAVQAFETYGKICKRFKNPPKEALSNVIYENLQKQLTNSNANDLLLKINQLYADLLVKKDIDTLEQLTEFVTKSNRYFRKTEAWKKFSELQKEYKEIVRLQKNLASLKAKLKKTPDNPKLNLAFLNAALQMNEPWYVYAPCLRYVGDENLAKCVSLDIQKKVTDENAMEVADAYWDASEKAKKEITEALKQRAFFHYKKILEKQKGLQRLKVEKRIADVLNVSKLDVEQTQNVGPIHTLPRGVLVGRLECEIFKDLTIYSVKDIPQKRSEVIEMMTNIEIPKRCQKSDNFALRFNGYLRITQEGDYSFYLTSDDGSALYIEGQEPILNDGPHAERCMVGTPHLKAGWHKFTLLYFDNKLDNILFLKMELRTTLPSEPRPIDFRNYAF